MSLDLSKAELYKIRGWIIIIPSSELLTSFIYHAWGAGYNLTNLSIKTRRVYVFREQDLHRDQSKRLQSLGDILRLSLPEKIQSLSLEGNLENTIPGTDFTYRELIESLNRQEELEKQKGTSLSA